MALCWRYQVDVVEALCVIGQHRAQHRVEVTGETLDGATVKQGRGIFQCAADDGPALLEGQRQIKLGNAVWTRSSRLHTDSGQIEICARGVLPGEDHLEQRAVGQAAGWVQQLHDLLEGHLLILLAFQRPHLHLREQLSDCQSSRDLDPQCQGVHKKADQILNLRVAAVRDRGADHNIFLTRQPCQDY